MGRSAIQKLTIETQFCVIELQIKQSVMAFVRYKLLTRVLEISNCFTAVKIVTSLSIVGDY